MRRTLGPVKNARVLLFKTNGDCFYRWAIVQYSEGIDSIKDVVVDFPLGVLSCRVMSFGVSLTEEAARRNAIRTLEEYHFPNMSAHEKIALRGLKWRPLTENEKKRTHIRGNFPPIEAGEHLIARNAHFT